MKKLISLILALTLTFSLGITASATTGSKTVDITYRGIKIVLDGETLTPMDARGSGVEPFIMDGTTYLPVRAVADALGLNVGWDHETSTITIRPGGMKAGSEGEPAASHETRSVTISYRDVKLVINGEELTPTDANGNPVEPFIMDGSTYLPVRAVASALGLEVGWDAATSTVILSSPGVYLPTGLLIETTYNDDYTSFSTVGEVEYEYSESGAPIAMKVNAAGLEYLISFEYDSRGNVTRISAEGEDVSYLTEFSYDENGYLLREHSRQGGYTYTDEWSYDANGNVLTNNYKETSEGYTYSYSEKNTYDSQGCLLKSVCVIDGSRETYSYTYDDMGNLSGCTWSDSAGNSYNEKWSYDAAGNILSYEYRGSDGASESWSYTYDENSNLVESVCTYDGFTGSYVYAYDANGNLICEKYSDSDGAWYSDEWSYNAKGDLLSNVYSDSEGSEYTLENEYDSLGRLVGYVETSGGSVTSFSARYGGAGDNPVCVVVESEGAVVTITVEYALFASDAYLELVNELMDTLSIF